MALLKQVLQTHGENREKVLLAFKDTKSWRQIAQKIYYYKQEIRSNQRKSKRATHRHGSEWPQEDVEKLLESVRKNGRDVYKAIEALGGKRNKGAIWSKLYHMTKNCRQDPSLPYASLLLE